MHQLDVLGEQVLEPETVDGVGVSAAHLHEAVVPPGPGQPADLVGGRAMSFGSRNSSTYFIGAPPHHSDWPSSRAPLHRGLALAEHREHPHLIRACAR